MAPQQQHMLAWRFILLWLTVILTVSPQGWTVSLSLYFSLCFSSFSLIMSVSSTLFATLLSLSFSLHLSICFCLIFNPSIHLLSSSITLLLFCLFQPPLGIPPLLSLHYIYTFVIISASLSLIPPPLCLLPSLPLFPPLPLPPTLRWRGVNMSSTCGLIVPSQQSKTTTLKLLNRLHQMTSASSLLPFFALFSPLRVEMLNNHEAMPGRQD